MINLKNIHMILDTHLKRGRTSTRSSLNFEETANVTLIGKLYNFTIKITLFNIFNDF